MRPTSLILAAMCAAAGLAACSSLSPKPTAVAELAPTQGNSVAGQVQFVAGTGGVTVHAHLTGLKPNAEHGFHVHEKGDCSAPDATSAGAHFNPAGHAHGAPNVAHHDGDMPALKADAQGVADVSFPLPGVGIGAGTDLVGHAVIVHAMPDDYQTQPTGNSGARIACGVIARR